MVNGLGELAQPNKVQLWYNGLTRPEMDNQTQTSRAKLREAKATKQAHLAEKRQANASLAMASLGQTSKHAPTY